ncbi:UDP-glucose 6-dehydrogenase [Penicillium ucsense]|uniref:UDP-glucose 6-dehydrogenase n=1 Tax=Penicillium ucsense TaxID=2839758 RepID=A0A8J8WB51_9EURO|nr:UDP-glucose 6-dehydrogenase [Penicillium ucsense]KAF7734854.1 UDP-glucose 6-dehydrogenase [Penicillium ucsense]
MSSDEIAMEVFPSSPSASEGSLFCETGPTTPSGSPLFRPSQGDEIKFASFPQSRDLSETGPLETVVKNICVVGAGYVGTPTAAILALHHPSVAIEVLDRDPLRIQQWRSLHLPVHEPGLETVVRIVRDGAEISCRTGLQNEPRQIMRGKNLFFTCDSARAIPQADIILMAVNTPTKTFGVGAGCATNMTAFDGAMRDVATHAKPGAIIVEKSTVPGGTAERVRKLLATHRPNVPFEVLSNPEFLAEGTAIENLTAPDRVLIGSAPTPSGRRAAQVLASLYETWVPRARIIETNAWSSELAKLVANAMLAQRISSINSISAICEKTGADVSQVAKAIGMDDRIGPKFLKAGLGFGGSCFRKDIASLAYLAESLGLDDVAHYWRQVNTMNERQRDRFSRKIIDRFDGNLVRRKLALLGFAFKKNTGDTRESLAVGVVQALLEERPAEIAIFDPYCRSDEIERELKAVCSKEALSQIVKIYPDPYMACSQAHAVLVVTDCDQFRNTPSRDTSTGLASMLRERKLGPSITEKIDVQETRRARAGYKPETWSHAGVTYHLQPQEPCPEDCKDCRPVATLPLAAEMVEWPRIAYNMVEPKWVFDGRGVLDAAELERLGVRVDVVGRRTRDHHVA